ncbi:restriction endonuclease subunit S [Chryseobacterium echinoideorum]|uniref:restriction endonuclease subunit S n=1 Tax=Chryseobacterium echinoideorum TaxID=1549648 RepID=UPI0011851EF1|nr:restriction endonuclease subunit S [Chryseobacterium echinoideorum]
MDKTLLKIQQKNIPVSWRVERFGDVFDFLSTATYSRDILKESGEVQYLHYGDIHTKYNFHLDFTKNNLPFITEIERRNYPYMKNGDLVLADASEDYDGVGKGVEIKNLGDSKAISGLHTFLLRDKDSNFVLGYKGFIPSCDVVREQFYRFATGTKVYSLSKESLSNVKVLIPPKEEQKAIADCLSTWDDAIEKQTKLIAAKQQRKKALMQQLLSGKKRLPGFTETWKTFLIEDISKIGRGRVISKEYLNENQGIYPVYSSQTVNDGVFGRIKTYDYDGAYITWTTDGVNAGTVTYREGKFNCTNVCGTIKLKDSSINPRFLAYKLNTIAFRYVSRTLANPKLMNNVMASITIDLPYLDEQNKIADILQSAELEIRKNIIKLNLLKFQKKGLMQKLLIGQVRINQ